MRLLLLVLLIPCLLVADPESIAIGKKYNSGVVKILLHDPTLAERFGIDQDQAYLTRGSGFFVTKDGVIFTNRHVIEWCVWGYMVVDWTDETGKLHELDVVTYQEGMEKDPRVKKVHYIGHAVPMVQVFRKADALDYSLYNAEVHLTSENFDGAILKITTPMDGGEVTEKFTAVPIGDSDNVEMGEDLVILGYPAQYVASDLKLDLRDTLTMSQGRMSGWDFVFDENGMMKTDAAIHEGNSGGPVFDNSKKVIGIATAMGIKTQIGLVEGINDMYLVAKSDSELITSLNSSGLKSPKKAKAIKAISGRKRNLPELKQTSDTTPLQKWLRERQRLSR